MQTEKNAKNTKKNLSLNKKYCFLKITKQINETTLRLNIRSGKKGPVISKIGNAKIENIK